MGIVTGAVIKRTAWFSRRVVDPANSVAWFSMDALWLLQLAWPAYVATGLTLVTGAALVFLNRGRAERLDDDLDAEEVTDREAP